MQINLITIFPEYFEAVLGVSILGRAQNKGLLKIKTLSLRDFADGKPDGKKMVDDKPFGGGAGMVMKIEPIDRALESLKERGEQGRVVLTAAGGEIFNQQIASDWSQLDYLTIICGHYEGVDARVKNLIDAEISLGQFVLTGGEPAALTMIDATARLLEGALGNPASLVEESHSEGVLGEIEYPQYTQPREYKGWTVPEVLLSGHHAQIAAWRAAQKKTA